MYAVFYVYTQRSISHHYIKTYEATTWRQQITIPVGKIRNSELSAFMNTGWPAHSLQHIWTEMKSK